ncbi:MAG: DUF4412 domain-containing protein [Nitrospirae bacterium]|nr:DUF4412 domain-containing protein [Nitrospirota bacterium]
MKHCKRILFTLIITMLFGMTAWAVEKAYQEPKVEYSADQYMETEDVTMKAKIFHAQGKERREQDMEGMKQIMITRTDKKLVWMLMPEQKMYMEMKMNQSKEDPTDLRDYKIEQEVMGEEVVNGVNATKSKVIMTDKKGNKFGGFMWSTKDGIMVKMDTVSKAEGKKMRMKTELKNLKLEKQDPKLFEVPSGYMKMPGMGGGFNMQEMMKGGE